MLEGKYKVFDENGIFLYEMRISNKLVIGNIDEPSTWSDSLMFENFDNKFSYTVIQPTQIPENYPINFFYLGHFEKLIDHDGNRWDFEGLTDTKHNSLQGDTIKLRFELSNAEYYLEDEAPYFNELCLQIAVKQH